jgi:hypothetical protein
MTATDTIPTLTTGELRSVCAGYEFPARTYQDVLADYRALRARRDGPLFTPGHASISGVGGGLTVDPYGRPSL